MSVSWSYTREITLEVASRYARGLGEEAVVLAITGIVVGAWLFLLARRVGLRWASWPLVALMSAAGAWWAWALRWVADDAFISFRYARNLLHGHGLVYNVGERVEGYTNFLWTILVGAAGGLGFDLAQTSVVLSLVCFAGTIFAIAIVVRRLSAGEEVAFPLASAAFAGNYASASFATSGLETMLCTLAVVLAFERALAGRHLVSGLLGVAATLARPDHALFYAALFGALVLSRAPRRALVRYAVPFFALFVPYFLWRWSYYGYVFPNTFYAKGGADWHVQQGARYLGLSAIALGLWGVVPLAVHEAWKRRGELAGRYALLVLLIYLLYLLKVGGDFMLGRFVVVLLPLVFVLAELSIRRLVAAGRFGVAVLASASFLFVVVPNHVVRPGEKLLHVADERTFYGLRSFSPLEVDSGSTDWAHAFNAIFADGISKPSVATGVVGIFGYETGLHLIDIYGLLDPVVAHKPIRSRGRPGHEKRSSPARIYEVGTDLSDMPIYPPPFRRWTKVRIPPFPLFMPRFDAALVAQLNADGKRRARSIEPYLRRLRPSYDASTRDCQRWFVDRYYFESHPDAPLAAELRDRFGSTEGIEHLTALFFDESPPGWSRAALETFDGDASLEWTFDRSPGFDPVSIEPRADQRFVSGHRDAFVSTFDPTSRGERRLGMTSAEFEVAGDAITFQIGGGRSEGLHVELLVEGAPVRGSTGCESDLMGRRVWDVRALRGKRVQLRIRDDDDDPEWGYLVVDTFEQWTPLLDDQ